MKKTVVAVCSVVLAGVLVSGAVLAKGAVDRKNAIGSQAALEIALADAGVRQTDVRNENAVFEREGVRYVYDVAFDCGANEYDYTIDAKSGEILVRDVDKDDDVPTATVPTTVAPTTVAPTTVAPTTVAPTTVAPTTEAATKAEPVTATTERITLDRAKQIAVADAKLDIEKVHFTKAETDMENGARVYEIEFVHDGVEYEYCISLAGEILQKEIDSKRIYTPTQKQESIEKTSGYISIERAKEIVLDHANLTASDVRFKKAVREYDDGIAKYEIEFTKGRTQYEYSMDAKTGKILEYDIDKD